MLKIAKLPDKTTTKMAFNASVALNEDLQAYTALYRKAYSATATVSELIPLMLMAFLRSDPVFIKARREQGAKAKQNPRPAIQPTPQITEDAHEHR